MAKYYIHCCMERSNYVAQYLVPSMLDKGIDRNDIMIYFDVFKKGNLRAFLESCEQLISGHWKHEDGVWHLQDDIILCRDFKKRTEEYDCGLVCGFTCKYDNTPKPGQFLVREEQMWFSFPCIRIPTDIMKHFIHWADAELWRSDYFKEVVKRNRGDDFIFREFLIYYYPELAQTNLAPNLVDHIDYLLGGSVCNKWRDTNEQPVRSIYFNDLDLVDELSKKLYVDSDTNI